MIFAPQPIWVEPVSQPTMLTEKCSYSLINDALRIKATSNDQNSAVHLQGSQVQLPGLVPPLQVDTEMCTMIVVFPRGKSEGGMLSLRETVEAPLEQAAKIFDVIDNPCTLDSLQGFDHIGNEPIRLGHYQADIRKRFLEVLSKNGVSAMQFPSIDEDEDFVKLFLPLEGFPIEEMAEKLEYHMPYKPSIYDAVQPHGPFPGLSPMCNDRGEEVVAHGIFQRAQKHKFQAFRQMDAVRILELWLHRWVSLDAMVRQKVIVSYFPCPDVGALEEIHRKVLSPSSWLDTTLSGLMGPIRDYFGEEIAFYFHFVRHLCNSILLLGFLGIVFRILRCVWLSKSAINVSRSIIALGISLFAAITLQFFYRSSARLRQLWGVEGFEKYTQYNLDWKHDGHGENWGIIVNCMAMLYILAYVGTISALLKWQHELDAESDGANAAYSALLVTAVIKGGAFIWTKVAPLLVHLENRRTQDEYSQKLAALLAIVKLFVANFPFVQLCFLNRFTKETCAETFDEAAAKVWPSFDATKLKPDVLDLLQKGFSNRYEGSVCIRGCRPFEYTKIEPSSETDCEVAVEANLETYFIFSIAVEIAFLVYPILASYWEIRKEYKKLESQRNVEELRYSVLQWEAKKFRYSFDSWGGDHTNDFLDMAVAYSVMALWGSITPLVAFVGVLSLIASFRLRIYRMLYVTQRPFPRASAGLGIWRDIFEWINVAAVTCNVGLACFFFTPGRLFDPSFQIGIFLLGEHVVLLLQATVRFCIHEHPREVKAIDNYNEHVLNVMNHDQQLSTGAASNLSHINLTLELLSVSSSGTTCTESSG